MWSNAETQRKSTIKGDEHSYTFNFARWYFTTYYIEKLSDEYNRAGTLNKIRKCILIIKDAKDSRLRAEFVRLEEMYREQVSEAEKYEAEISALGNENPVGVEALQGFYQRQEKLVSRLSQLRNGLADTMHELRVMTEKVKQLESAESTLSETMNTYSEYLGQERELNQHIATLSSERLAIQNRLNTEMASYGEISANLEAAKLHIEKLRSFRSDIADEKHRQDISDEISALSGKLEQDTLAVNRYEKEIEGVKFSLSLVDHKLHEASNDMDKVRHALRNIGPAKDLIYPQE